jgi:hypothetical protein
MKLRFLQGAAAGVALFYASYASAGLYADDLGKCLVAATTKDDRIALIRWLFVAASHHAAVKTIMTVTPTQQDESDKIIGALTTRLLTESCKSEAQKALQYEGAVTFQLAFEVLGKVAGQELFTSPDVAASMKGLSKYIDADKLKALGEPKSP